MPTPAELKEILRLHRMWRNGEAGGARADLRDAYLRDAYLGDANLGDAYLRGAYLWGANLGDANLGGANLGGASLRGAYLGGANLGGADLGGADLGGADLGGAVGNMREVKSAQIDTWPITWTTAPDGVVTVQIGCQRHPLDMWRKGDPRWIAAMDPMATEWWGRYGSLVLGMVEASPAVPWGKPVVQLNTALPSLDAQDREKRP